MRAGSASMQAPIKQKKWVLLVPFFKKDVLLHLNHWDLHNFSFESLKGFYMSGFIMALWLIFPTIFQSPLNSNKKA
jgi:hypothetical protein